MVSGICAPVTTLRFDTVITNSFHPITEMSMTLGGASLTHNTRQVVANNAKLTPHCHCLALCCLQLVTNPLHHKVQGRTITHTHVKCFYTSLSDPSDSSRCAWTTKSASNLCRSKYLRNAGDDHSPAFKISHSGAPEHCRSSA